MSKAVILSRLLDKYENSKHLLEPGASLRRVMLKAGKKEFPEYNYEDASIRDTFNDAANSLEKDGLVKIEWLKNRPVISCITLNLEKVLDCYKFVGRIHPKDYGLRIVSLMEEKLPDISTDWIAAWKEDICREALDEFKVPTYCKSNLTTFTDLLKAFCVYDSLRGDTITMRAFSNKCYRDTKHFERSIRELFLRIARKYNSNLAEICLQEELGIRDQLAYLGIYARPELYELAGDIAIQTRSGILDLHAAVPYGIALPSTVIDSITSIDLRQIKKVTFIENKTNYDEYILSEMGQDELTIFHGGFISPQKRKLFTIINSAVQYGVCVSFWADIDLGGFQMFEQLQQIIPCVTPMRMSAQDVAEHHANGLSRSADYLSNLEGSHFHREGNLFRDTIDQILNYGVTIEQETFLL